MTHIQTCAVAWSVTAARIELERGRTDKSRQILEKIELLLRPHVDQQAADAVIDRTTMRAQVQVQRYLSTLPQLFKE